jgi:hypothetical protein
MKLIKFIFMLISSMTSLSLADSPEDLAAMMRGLNKLTDLAKDQGSLSKDQYIEKLGIGLVKTSHSRIYRIPERQATYELLQATMISIPGHAEYYEKRIRGMWDGYRSAKKTDPSTADGTKFLNGTFYDFPVLRHLPSPETVRVLGDMVIETEVFETEEGVPNIHLAARALQELHHLPLASKPVQSQDVHTDEDLETYRLWYAQIKAGNRTFRFEGDPNEYTLAGPVRSSPDLAASPPKARDAIEAVSAGEAEFKLSTRWFWVMLGGVLVVGGLVYLVVSRGSRARPN